MVLTENILVQNLQQVFDTFCYGVLIECKDRNIISTNRRFLEIFGIPGESTDLIGYNCLDAALASKSFFKNPDKFERDIIEIPRSGISQEEVIAATDGRYFKRKYEPIYQDGELVLQIWSYEDVTALIHKEKELLQQKNYYHTMLNEIPADIAVFSPEHKYMYLNKTAIKNEEMRTWLIGKDDYDYFRLKEKDPSLADGRRALFNRAKETGESVTWIDENIAANGKKDYVLRIFYPYFNDSKHLEFVIGYGINITEQKEQQLAIDQQKERFKTLIDKLNDGVFQLSFDGDIMFYNHAFIKAMNLTGYTMPEKYTSDILQFVHPDDKSALYYAFDQLRIRKQPQKGIFRVIDYKTNTTQFVDYYIWYSYSDKDGNLVAGRLSDVTERVVTEQNMLQLIDREKDLNNMKSNFIHITSHELRTPLSVIMSSAEILEMYEDMDAGDNKNISKAERKKFTTGIVKEVKRITDILNELLMVGRIENNKIKYEPKHTNAAAYVQSIADELYLPYTDGRKLQINIDEQVDNIYIDKSLMRHAIVNLVNNAFKYSEGCKSPSLYIFKKEEKIYIEVKDFGIGIPEKELENLFHSFYRASNVGNISGTGIGLMVVDHAIKTHGGNIHIDSKAAQGSTFTITIPHVQQ